MDIIKRFYLVAKPFFVSDKKWHAFSLLFLIATLSLASRGIDVKISYISRDFMNALQLREKEEYFRHLYRYLGAFLFATPLVILYGYTEQRLSLMWWQWLSKKILELYLSNHAYYRVLGDERIDNADQRIAEDTRTFTSTSLSFFLIIFNSILTFIAFIGILWTISRTLAFCALVCAFISSLVTYLLGKPLIKYNFLQRQREADYRYKLVNLRDHAESIAFSRGEKDELRRTRQRLHKAGENLKNIIAWSRNLGFFTQGYNYLIGVIPIVIVAPLYFDQKIDFGKITQAGLAFAQVLGSLNIIVSNFGNISTLFAVVTRLGSFWEVVIEDNKTSRKILTKESNKLVFNNVTIYTPRQNRLLSKNIQFQLEDGQRLLVTGPSGSGKSSILRVIAGFWSNGAGEIIRPPLKDMIFLPQRPYTVIGNLRSQFLYASTHKGLTDQELLDVIKQVQLEKMFKRIGDFESILDWQNILSTGEQQKIAFARLFLARPQYAFLDEATTAISHQDEEILYRLLSEKTKNFISVGHRSNLAKYHTHILDLQANGEWTFSKIEDQR